MSVSSGYMFNQPSTVHSVDSLDIFLLQMKENTPGVEDIYDPAVQQAQKRH